MNEDQIRAIVKQVIQDELRDLIKTINRLYEDRELYVDVKKRVGTLEDVTRDIVERLRTLGKDFRADIKDVKVGIDEIKDNIE